jgi:hypothetical protein
VVDEYFIAKHLLLVLCEDKRHICVRDSNAGELVVGATGEAEHAEQAKQGEGRSGAERTHGSLSDV